VGRRHCIAAVGGLLALAGPASAQTDGFVVDGPYTVSGGTTIRANVAEPENTIVSNHHVRAPGTQVGSEG
jgi:hypothetical protein